MSLCYTVGEVEIRPDERRALARGKPVALGARAFDLLLCLIEHRDRIVTKQELMDLVWPGLVVEESNLTVHVSALRKLLGAQAVATVPGRGYRFTMEATLAPAPAAPAAPVLAGDPVALALPDKPSIAVLPFANLSGDPKQDCFIDGITEDIITELSRFRSLFVIARNSAFSYKGKAVDVRTVARELGVQYVLEGSVRRVANRVRVTGQLIDALSGAHLWAEKYDREPEDIFVVQEELTTAIVGSIGQQIDSSELGRARAVRPGSLTAHVLAMRARAAGRRGTTQTERESFEEALRLGYQALAVDPQCGAAWCAIASSKWGLIWLGATPSLADTLHEGVSAARCALVIDSQNNVAHMWKGLLLAHTGEQAAGLADMRRAHELNPNDAHALAMLGLHEAGAGDPQSGIRHARAARRLSPRDPLGFFYFFCGAMAQFFAGDYSAALADAQRAVSEAPNFFNAHMALVLALVGAGRTDDARAHFSVLRALSPNTAEARLAGHWPFAHPPFVQRALTFFRIAASLEDPGAADVPIASFKAL